MNPNRKPPRKFDTMWDLITELNAAGHPDDTLWYRANSHAGEEQINLPRDFLSADCRVIGQRHGDGKWTTLYGYDDPVLPGGPFPADAHNQTEMRDRLERYNPKGYPDLENK